MILIKSANLALSFLLELGMLGALGYWGFWAGNGSLMKWALGIGTPLLAAAFWGIFLAPRASVELSASLHLLLELTIFGLATLALYRAGQTNLAAAFGLIYVVNRILSIVWGQ
jgi:hypothetical protein